jgi:hypothetical protein
VERQTVAKFYLEGRARSTKGGRTDGASAVADPDDAEVVSEIIQLFERTTAQNASRLDGTFFAG